MFWFSLAILAVLGAVAALAQRRRYESADDEPWRASLPEDEPLDVEEARRAEEEFLANGWDPDEDEEPWRG